MHIKIYYAVYVDVYQFRLHKNDNVLDECWIRGDLSFERWRSLPPFVHSFIHSFIHSTSFFLSLLIVFVLPLSLFSLCLCFLFLFSLLLYSYLSSWGIRGESVSETSSVPTMSRENTNTRWAQVTGNDGYLAKCGESFMLHMSIFHNQFPPPPPKSASYPT
jgi:hypothetical protein